MHRPDPVVRILAVAHDPGGANAVAATAVALRAQGAEVIAVAKGPAQAQFRRLAVACRPFDADAPLSGLTTGVDLVLAGTSETDALERDVTAAAAALGIPSVALIDYWMNHDKRFPPATAPGAPLPDHLIAIDDRCRRQMIAEGLPADRIEILGQPYFSMLLSRDAAPHRVAAPATRLLFVSQPGSEAVPALEALLSVLTASHEQVELTIRFHPREAESRDRLAQVDAAAVPYLVDDSVDPLDMARSVDAVIGISSMILIETSLAGVPTAAFGGGVAALAAYRLCVPLGDREDVRAFLRAPRLASPDAEFLERQRGAAERVAAFCIALARRVPPEGVRHTVQTQRC